MTKRKRENEMTMRGFIVKGFDGKESVETTQPRVRRERERLRVKTE